MIPVKVVGAGLAIQFFYHNMRRLGNDLKSDPDVSIPWVVFEAVMETFRSGLVRTLERVFQSVPVVDTGKSIWTSIPVLRVDIWSRDRAFQI